ncbi:hypothetical protein [Lacticaseibacillus yichunensis]|nr:hypothetical protein [Lacticaseibacillus yichunensis]
MASQDLLMDNWRLLPDDRRRFIFEQLTRYFLSPLLAVDALVPVSVSYFGQVLQTFDALIGGEWLRFVPGQRHVKLGIETPLPTELAGLAESLGLSSQEMRDQLSAPAVVDLPPMLVARSSVASDEEVIGQINLTTQVFRGNHFAYVPYKPTVLSLIEPRTTSLDPAAQEPWPAVLTAGQVVLRLASSHHYQVALKHRWTKAALVKQLGGFGFALPTARDYEWLLGGGFLQLFAWGNAVPETLPAYLPNRFGLTFPTQRSSAELTQGDEVAAAPYQKGDSLLKLSPFYRAAVAQPFEQQRYRKLVRIELN